MSDTVKLRYAAASNITFHGEIDTGINREEWDDMDPSEREEVVADYVFDLIDIWELAD